MSSLFLQIASSDFAQPDIAGEYDRAVARTFSNCPACSRFVEADHCGAEEYGHHSCAFVVPASAAAEVVVSAATL